MKKNKVKTKALDKEKNDSKPKNNNLKTKKATNDKTICKYPKHMSDASINWKRLALKLDKCKTESKKGNNNSNNTNNTNNTGSGYKTNKTKYNKMVVKNETKTDEIWFDGVDNCLIKSSMMSNNGSNDKSEKLVKEKSFTGLTKIVAMDCEMVGTGSDGSNSVLARVSIVNFFGHCVYDKYVKPIEEITDYRTHVSGIRPSNLANALEFKTVQKEVNDILKDRIIVGHALKNDFKVLFLSHPKHKIRDTSKYFRHLFGGRNPSLKRLSETVLGVNVQSGEHNSVEDAQVAMRLFTMYRRKWEAKVNTKTAKVNTLKKTNRHKTHR